MSSQVWEPVVLRECSCGCWNPSTVIVMNSRSYLWAGMAPQGLGYALRASPWKPSVCSLEDWMRVLSSAWHPCSGHVRSAWSKPGCTTPTWWGHWLPTGRAASRSSGDPEPHLDFATMKRGTVLTAQVCALLSRWLPERIVCCSFASCTAHQRMGYDRSRSVIIPNGFDLERFRPEPQARQEVRVELGIPADAELVGLAARFDPIKTTGILSGLPGCSCSGCRRSISCSVVMPSLPKTASWHPGSQMKALAGRCTCWGAAQTCPAFWQALDVAVSSSRGEAFPNIVGEAMACGVPCAVTDVGDSSLIVGKTGLVVPMGEPEALARAMEKLLQLAAEKRVQLGLAARQRIQEQYNISDIAARYARMYEEVLNKKSVLEHLEHNQIKPG